MTAPFVPSPKPPAPAAGKPKPELSREPPPKLPKEVGGQQGPEPTRYGDWEKNGRCTDF